MTVTVTARNNGSTANFTWEYSANGSSFSGVVFNFGSIAGSGGEETAGPLTDQSDTIWYRMNKNSPAPAAASPWVKYTGDQNLLFIFDGSAWEAPPTNCYCYYHVQWSNPGPKVADFRVYYENGTEPDGDAGVRRAVIPGSGVDFWVTNNIGNCTNSCPRLIWGDARADDSSGDGFDDGTSVSVGGGGSGPDDGSGGVVTTPSDDPGLTNRVGGYSTNLATTGDIVKLGDRILKGLGDLNIDVVGGLTGVADAVGTNGGGGDSELLEQIITNTLASAEAGASMADLIRSNRFWYTNYLDGTGSNAVFTEGLSVSNAWFGAWDYGRSAGGVLNGTNLAEVSESEGRSVWSIVLRTNLGGGNVSVNIWPTTANNPMVAGLFWWCRNVVSWSVTITALLYILYRVRHEVSQLVYIPGASPFKGGISSFFGWLTSNAVMFGAMVTVPVIALAGIDGVLGVSGGVWSNPFSSTVLATADSGFVSVLKGIIYAIEQVVPLSLIMGMFVYLTTFDFVMTGKLLLIQRGVKALTQ